MRYALTVVFSGVLSLAAAVALADDTVQLASGTRVRVTVRTGGDRLVGTVIALDDTNLTLHTESPRKLEDRRALVRTVPAPTRTDTTVLRREDLSKVAVYAGRRSRGKGALIGTAIWGGAGALLGLAAGGDDPGTFIRLSAGEKALLAAMVLAPIGAVVGAVAPPAEQWKELPEDRIRLSLVPVSGRGAAVSLAFVF